MIARLDLPTYERAEFERLPQAARLRALDIAIRLLMDMLADGLDGEQQRTAEMAIALLQNERKLVLS